MEKTKDVYQRRRQEFNKWMEWRLACKPYCVKCKKFYKPKGEHMMEADCFCKFKDDHEM